jgi:hypothetical protein
LAEVEGFVEMLPREEDGGAVLLLLRQIRFERAEGGLELLDVGWFKSLDVEGPCGISEEVRE